MQRFFQSGVLILTVAALLAASAAGADETARPRSMAEIIEGDAYLPIGLTEEEEGMLDLIGRDHLRTPPASTPVRQPGEFEPMTGIIVRYPFGNPTNLLVEYAEDTTLWVIVASTSQQTTVESILSSAGANMDHVEFIIASTNTIWVRDYGPWFIFDGDGIQGIVDHIYNRPRPLDDVIPATIGALWSIPVYGMPLEATGGNYMTDGRGIGMSTRLILDENPGLTTAEVDSVMHEYTGIDRYEHFEYVQLGGIHHLDCWAKLLSPSKILIKELPPTHSDYARLEANVDYIESITNCYGRPYEIVRVYTPDNEPYTNSLIVNDKVYVPMYGTAWDDDAIASYQVAMPGYEILGYTGSWLTDDAIHCRAMGVTDRYMLEIDHTPHFDTASTREDYRIEAMFIDHSEAGVNTDSLFVYWKVAGAPAYAQLAMVPAEDTYYADIPAQNVGTVLNYYVWGADYSGRRESHPYIGSRDPHAFEVVIDTDPPQIDHTPIGDLSVAAWPPTAVATVTDNLEVGSVTLESWIEGVQQVDVELTRVEGSFSYEGVFPGTAVAGDVVTYRIAAEDLAVPPNVTYDPPTGSHEINVVEAITAVIWEPDPSPISGAAIAALLDTREITHDYTTTVPNFNEYQVAFVCLGVYSQNYSLSTAEATALVEFLDGGGNVYMEGGDAWAYDSARTIYNPYFGVNGTSDGSGDLYTVEGLAGTMCEGMDFTYSGGNSYIDHMMAVSGGVKIFRNPGDNAGCGVSNATGTYCTVGCSFEFGGLVDGESPSTRSELMDDYLEHFGITGTSVPGGEEIAPRFALEQNTPNPFNPVTTIAFELPASGEIELAVYSASGRRVATLVDADVVAGRHAVTWRGLDDAGRRVASGVYFFRLTRGSESITRKAVLLK
jgi:agmatine/peptidylarginine deiminase